MDEIKNKTVDFSSASLEIMRNTFSLIGPARHTISWEIISQYSKSANPLDILAVAFAYEREGAKYRTLSIKYFEKYLISPVSTDLFSNWLIFSTLGKLYEKEYRFEDAVYCYNRLITESNGTNSADYTRIGDVYLKQDVNKSVKYYEDLAKEPCYLKHKRTFDLAYKDAMDKQSKGYVYKPRRR